MSKGETKSASSGESKLRKQKQMRYAKEWTQSREKRIDFDEAIMASINNCVETTTRTPERIGRIRSSKGLSPLPSTPR